MTDNTLRNQSDIGAGRTPKAQPLGNVSGELVEILADIEHERWSSWMQWLFENGQHHGDGSFTISPDKTQRWIRLAATPYSELDEPTKEYDRIEVRKTLSAIKNRLPKEKPEPITGHDKYGYWELDDFLRPGYNTCLAEVKQALDIESES